MNKVMAQYPTSSSGLPLVLLLALLSAGTALSQTIPDDSRIDCAPDSISIDSLESECIARGCIYAPATFDGVPWCYYPENYGYSLEGIFEIENGIGANLVRNSAIGSMFGSDFEKLILEAEFQTDDRLRIKITPAEGPPRFEVPLNIPTGPSPTKQKYEVNLAQGDNTFGIQVIRKSTGVKLFDTNDMPGFVYSDQFIQIATNLPSTAVYGLGENEQPTYRHDLNWKTWTGYARDQAPDPGFNLYGVHPTYTVVEPDGNTHTVLFLNSNAQEWALTPKPGFIYRTIGGILDMYFFLGPTPSESASQYAQAVGRYPLPPYWSLGFHLCRYGYNTLENMQAAVNRTAMYDIPHDAQWGDIDVMERELDFTISSNRFAGLPEYVKELKGQGIKFVTILDPCISTGEEESMYRPLQLGNEMDVWLREPSGEYVKGRVWPADPVYFPDYAKQEGKDWWQTLIVEFHDLIEYDALWIDMNEPANFANGGLDGSGCEANNINYPPYKSRAADDDGLLAIKTLCPDVVGSAGNHYDTHSLFGWYESEPTVKAAAAGTGGRGWALSRSTFVGSGQWVAHWLGDNWSDWENLRFSIIGMLQFSRFAIPHVGADICGFINDSEEELCSRWHQLGAFYPFSRNHNAIGNIEQDPGVWGEPLVTYTREALHYRYRFLPYLYTLFYKHYTEGTLVARSLWDEFPTDPSTWDVDRQFMWGSGLLISPVVEQGATSVEAYFPDARWFEITKWIQEGVITETPFRGGSVSLSAPMDTLPLHIKGGTIFPLQYEARNTEQSTLNPWILLVALDDDENAFGSLFTDDGISENTIEDGVYFLADFTFVGGADSGTLSTSISNSFSGVDSQIVQTIEVVGIKWSQINSVTINGNEANEFTFSNGRLTIDGLAASLGGGIELLIERT